MATTHKSKSSSKTSIRRVAIVVAMTILIAGGGYIYSRVTSRNATSRAKVGSLQTARATVGNLVLFASGTGTIHPVPESNLSFNTSGQVSKIDVKIGDRVEAGQVLAQLDDAYAKIDLAEAQEAMNKLTSAAAIAVAKQSLDSAQFDFVSAKATLAHLISPEVLYWEEKAAQREQILANAQSAYQTNPSDAAKQKVSEAEASLKYARDSLSYFQKVYEYDYIAATFTQSQTIRIRKSIRTVPVVIFDATTGKKSDLVYPPSDGEIGMARADYNLTKASIAQAQTYLDVVNGADIPEGATGVNLVAYIQTKHALETAEYNLKATQLIAPISGTVTALDINVGDLAANGSPVITVSNLDQPYVLDAYIDGKDWGQIRAGYEVDATFDIIPDQVFKGIVTEVYPTLDTTSSNSVLVHFTARLSTTIPYELPAGSSTSVDVIGGSAENAVLVPVEALHKFGDGKYALFVMENGKLQLRLVEVGVMNLTKAEIISGLKVGDIVTTGVIKTK